MEVIYKKYNEEESIPIYQHVSNRKLVKYYSRDVMAAMVAVGELLKGRELSPETPFFFATAEFLPLDQFKELLKREGNKQFTFNSTIFVEKLVPTIPPLQYFKAMRNIAHCFIAIEHGLRGDNAALLGSISTLLSSALNSWSPQEESEILIGASRISSDGVAEGGAALITKEEIEHHPLLESPLDAIHFFSENLN